MSALVKSECIGNLRLGKNEVEPIEMASASAARPIGTSVKSDYKKARTNMD